MCGRFAITEDWSKIVKYYDISDVNYSFPTNYNIPPSTRIPSVITDTNGTRRIGGLTWGLRPKAWGDSASIQPINARVEGLKTNPVFRKLVERRRAILPCSGYFEWRKSDRQPHYIRVKSRSFFSLAGFYDTWTDESGERISTCAIITVSPGRNTRLRTLHDRQPAILHRVDERHWLDRSVTNIDDLLPVLEAYPEDDMEWFPVSKNVGNVANNSPECVRRIEA